MADVTIEDVNSQSSLAFRCEGHRYDLPFSKFKAYKVLQGYGGTHSHTGNSYFAIDFSMPIGTPVCAARSGVITKAVDKNWQGGPEEKYRPYWNYLAIRHSDYTTATYGHIQENGICVSLGEEVRQGQVIAFSGNTGWSTEPHLHFHVSSGFLSGLIKTTFSTIYDESDLLVEGNWYARRPGNKFIARIGERIAGPAIFMLRTVQGCVSGQF